MNSLLQTIYAKDMSQPLTTVTDYGYDTHDNLTVVTDPNANTTQYRFDDFGRRMQTISPEKTKGSGRNIQQGGGR